jgi:ADP-ribose pyrophosphatase
MEGRDVEVIEKTTPFQGYFRIDKYRLRHRLFEGGWSGEFTREVFERGHAVAILPYDPIADKLVLIEQFRMGAFAAAGDSPVIPADFSPWILECPAGIIDDGESLDGVARREMVEETGCVVQDLVPICKYLVSPGGASESVQLYCAKVAAPEDGVIHGLVDENENIRVRSLPALDIIRKLDTDWITSAEAFIALHWFARKRDELRRRWG